MIVAGELLALLATVTLPLTAPATVGAKATVSVTDWPGVSMVLALTPLAPNPAPEVVTPAIVTFALPVFVMVTFCGAEDVPVVTLPKLRLVGLMLRVRVAAIPVPARVTEVGEVGALLTMEMLPDAAPTNVGRKATVIVVCCPAFKFKGKVKPLML